MRILRPKKQHFLIFPCVNLIFYFCRIKIRRFGEKEVSYKKHAFLYAPGNFLRSDNLMHQKSFRKVFYVFSRKSNRNFDPVYWTTITIYYHVWLQVQKMSVSLTATHIRLPLAYRNRCILVVHYWAPLENGFNIYRYIQLTINQIRLQN